MQRILEELFAPDNAGPPETKWEVGDCIGQWWRPNFETSLYPYIPEHVTRLKECKKMYMIPLPQKSKSHLPHSNSRSITNKLCYRDHRRPEEPQIPGDSVQRAVRQRISVRTATSRTSPLHGEVPLQLRRRAGQRVRHHARRSTRCTGSDDIEGHQVLRGPVSIERCQRR